LPCTALAETCHERPVRGLETRENDTKMGTHFKAVSIGGTVAKWETEKIVLKTRKEKNAKAKTTRESPTQRIERKHWESGGECTNRRGEWKG